MLSKMKNTQRNLKQKPTELKTIMT